MAHFAEIDEKGIVKRVIIAEQDFINSGAVGDPKNWIQTSYNTREGKHLRGGTPLRKNFAGKGYTYDKENDCFIPPKPFPSSILDDEKKIWIHPKPKPKSDIHDYIWNESKQDWDLLV